MHIRNILLVAAASCVLSTAAAFADDTSPDWSGGYVGAIVALNTSNTNFALPGDLDDVLLKNHVTSKAFAGGGLAGFSWQNNAWVYGLEADATSGSGTSSTTACNAVDGCFTYLHDSFTTLNNLHTNWSGRVRGRLGWSNGESLFYVSAGYSIEGTKLSLIGLCFDPANPTVPTVYNFSRSHTLSGYNLGLGFEHSIGDGLSLRTEYLFEDFGNVTYKGAAPEWNDRKIHARNGALRLELAYKL